MGAQLLPLSSFLGFLKANPLLSASLVCPSSLGAARVPGVAAATRQHSAMLQCLYFETGTKSTVLLPGRSPLYHT